MSNGELLDLFCVVLAQWETSDRNRAALASLGHRKSPEGWKRAQGRESRVDEEGRFRNVDTVGLVLLPQGFQDFARQVHQESEYAPSG